ncbi:ferredoxin [Natronospora cellulosivora (SeqCode)]
MAEKNNMLSENVAGEFYVDEQCIACELCVSEAEENFKMKDDGAYAYVYKQAESDSEHDACLDAMHGCPVDAIGDDGE